MPTVHKYSLGRGLWTHTKKSRLNNFTECFPVGKRTVTKININKDEEKEKSTLVQVSGGNNFLYPKWKI